MYLRLQLGRFRRRLGTFSEKHLPGIAAKSMLHGHSNFSAAAANTLPGAAVATRAAAVLGVEVVLEAADGDKAIWGMLRAAGCDIQLVSVDERTTQSGLCGIAITADVSAIIVDWEIKEPK